MSAPANPNRLGNNGSRFYSYADRPILIDCNFIVDSTNGNGLGIRSLKGQGVLDVFMYTSATAGKGNSGLTNPLAQSASEGLIYVRLANNYARYLGGFSGFVSPPSGAAKAINSTALTVGAPYTIATVGHGTLGAATIAPVADSSGSLASTYFTLYDNYGNTFVIWFYVTGVGGTAPSSSLGTLVQQTIAENASATAITTALSSTISLLPSGVSGVDSFTTSGGGTSTLTVTSTQTNPYSPLPGAPADGVIATGFTFANSVTNNNQTCWNKVGLPNGVIPNVNAGFVATATGFSTSGSSTGTVYAAGVSGITSFEVIGDANQTISPVPMGNSPNVGGWLLIQTLGATSSSTTTLVPTAPANNSTVGMCFYVDAK